MALTMAPSGHRQPPSDSEQASKLIMFTTIMYGFINEVTRQPASARIPLRAKHDGRQEQSVVRPRRKARPAAATTARRGRVTDKYLVLADSFKRAAGFY